MEEPGTAEWLFDLLIKLGQEDDAYHATGLVLMEYSGASVIDDGEEPEQGVPEEPGVEPQDDVVPAADGDLEKAISKLPKVKIRLDATPDELNPGRFAAMVDRVLNATPVTMHKGARKRRAQPAI